MTAKVQYTNATIDLPVFNLSAAAGQLSLSGHYDHPNSATNATIQARLTSSNLALGKVKQIQLLEPGLSGNVRISSDISATVRDKDSRPFDLTSLNADLSATGLHVANRQLGDLTFSAHTNQKQLTFRFDSNLAQSEIHSAGVSQLNGDYPTRAEASFKNIRYQNIAPFINQTIGTPLPLTH